VVGTMLATATGTASASRASGGTPAAQGAQ
jgi:hypothetical protein